MARVRNVKPEFFRHGELFDAEKKSGLPLRLAWIGLWTQCDIAGRFRWKARELKLEILPYDDVDFESVLSALEEGDFVERYAVDGKEFGVVPNFARHQRFSTGETRDGPRYPENPNHGKPRSAKGQTKVRPKSDPRRSDSGLLTPDSGLLTTDNGLRTVSRAPAVVAPIEAVAPIVPAPVAEPTGPAPTTEIVKPSRRGKAPSHVIGQILALWDDVYEAEIGSPYVRTNGGKEAAGAKRLEAAATKAGLPPGTAADAMRRFHSDEFYRGKDFSVFVSKFSEFTTRKKKTGKAAWYTQDDPLLHGPNDGKSTIDFSALGISPRSVSGHVHGVVESGGGNLDRCIGEHPGRLLGTGNEGDDSGGGKDSVRGDDLQICGTDHGAETGSSEDDRMRDEDRTAREQ